MKIDAMRLERWLVNEAKYNVGGGGVTKLKLGDITRNIDYEQLMKYGDTDGSPEMKAAVAEWFNNVEAENVLITAATSEGNLLVTYALLERGDEYVVHVPSYEQTVGLAKSLGADVKEFYYDESKKWQPDLNELNEKVSRRTKIIYVVNPNNPTGYLLSRKEMTTICEIAEDVGAYVHCDNALRGSEVDGKPSITPFEVYEKGIVTGSVSKLGATCPRIGWVIGNKEIVDECWKLKDYTTLSHCGMGESLALMILKKREECMKKNLALSKANIETLEKWVNKNSDQFSLVSPRGGFTSFPKYNMDINSEELCKKLLKERQVLATPGDYMGIDKHLRISIGCKNDTLVNALQEIEEVASSL